MNKNPSNSRDYWEYRFHYDWDLNAGPEQSRFFAQLALDNLPEWFKDAIRTKHYSVCDWGCAEGDGTSVLASFLSENKIVGVDFSKEAIKTATQRYPSISFCAENWTDEQEEEFQGNQFDVIFSSNTLEHFSEPFDLLRQFSRYGAKFVALMVPFHEYERHPEHFFTFLEENIPLEADGGFRLVFAKAVNIGEQKSACWNGEQIVLLYAKPSVIDGYNFHLSDVTLTAAHHDFVVDSLKVKATELEARIAGINKLVTSLEEQLNEIHQGWGWRILAPFRIASRAIEIVRTQGWKILAIKFYRALSYHFAKPLLKHLARRRLQQILRANPERTPVLFPPIVPWNLHLFQRPHHLAKELAACGYLYFFCVPVSRHDRVLTFEEVAPGCFITPYLELLEVLPGKIVHLYSTDNIQTLAWICDRLARGDRVLYEYIDEIHEDISRRHIPLQVLEKHAYLLRNEKITCVATADKLYQDVRTVRSRNCALITNGVDLAHFSARRRNSKTPSELVEIISSSRPIIGYFGALAKWFDYDLVACVARQMPQYEIILIGPDYDGSLHILESARLPNVHILGPVDYKQLPEYACWFDVSMIPFLINEITESTSPIKLFEYMALGHPIVTTNMPECRKYSSVLIGRDLAEFAAQIEHGLDLRENPEYQQLLREEAAANSWTSKAEAIDRLMRESSR